MDRNKPSSSRSGKSKIGAPHHGSEIFALGSKSSSTSSSRDDVKSKVMSSSTSSSKSSTDRKRDASTSLVSSTAKKPKLPSLGGSGSGGTSGSSVSVSVSHSSRIGETSTGTASTQQEYWEQVAQDCDASELVQSVLAAIDRQDSNQVRRIQHPNELILLISVFIRCKTGGSPIVRSNQGARTPFKIGVRFVAVSALLGQTAAEFIL